MKFEGSQIASLTKGTATALRAEHHEQVAALHDHLFPNTHLPGARMVAGLDQHKACFVKTAGDEVLGYVYLEVQSDTARPPSSTWAPRRRPEDKGSATIWCEWAPGGCCPSTT